MYRIIVLLALTVHIVRVVRNNIIDKADCESGGKYAVQKKKLIDFTVDSMYCMISEWFDNWLVNRQTKNVNK